jgi:hypothetical protein
VTGPQLWHVRLHEGRNRFARTFFVRHWDRDTIPAYVGQPGGNQGDPEWLN